MKKLITLLALTFSLLTIFGQAPEKMSYQAVVRNTSNELVVNTQVGIQISILLGSTSGTPVYVETQSPTTNANGVVTLEIGGGTVQSGVFADIDWANGTYFIKTETDITGGSTYTITGTSQLLSVPYALHAKTAESLTSSTSGHYVGELYGGGIVFWVDHTGEHGLIVSLYDLDGGSGVVWSNVDSVVIGGLGTWDGESNTNAIVSQLNHANSAAQLCLDYSNDGFDDWYLPAAYELKKLWDNIYEIQKNIDINNGIITDFYEGFTYWSSTEWVSSFNNKGYGIVVAFPNVNMYEESKYYARSVRAIRKF